MLKLIPTLNMMLKKAIIGGIFIYSLSLYAEVSFSVNFYRGGTSLDFGKVRRDSVVISEVKISITSQGKFPYQIKQVILEPLRNEKGKTLEEEVLYFYTLRGSNSRGSLYHTIIRPLSFQEEVLYISDSQGSPDSFKLVYLFEGKNLTTYGRFWGRLAYILQPREGKPQIFVFPIRFHADLRFDAQISLPQGRIRLNTRSEREHLKFADFSLQYPQGRRVRVWQRQEAPIVDSQGRRLPQGFLKFYISDKGEGITQFLSPTEVKDKELCIYTSDKGLDKFRINFVLDKEKIKEARAGIYKGKILYRASYQGEEKLLYLDLEIEVAKIFDIEVESKEFSFYNLKPDSSPQEREVIIKIKSNTEKPYQVTQRFRSPFVNEKGETISFKYLSMRQELLEGEGELKYSRFVSPSKSEEMIFISNSKGEPASFRIIYRLTPSWEIPPGNYSTSIVYSLSER